MDWNCIPNSSLLSNDSKLCVLNLTVYFFKFWVSINYHTDRGSSHILSNEQALLPVIQKKMNGLKGELVQDLSETYFIVAGLKDVLEAVQEMVGSTVCLYQKPYGYAN